MFLLNGFYFLDVENLLKTNAHFRRYSSQIFSYLLVPNNHLLRSEENKKDNENLAGNFAEEVKFSQVKKLNQEIIEALYFAAVSASMEEAKQDGPYKTHKGSPISKLEFHHNSLQANHSLLGSYVKC